MPTPITMPQLGETVVEGTIVKWLKGPGDNIERDEPLFEISTDKVDTEVPSPVAGVLKDIKVQEGETVSVGTELAVVEEEGGGAGDGEVVQEAATGQPAEAGAEQGVATQAAPTDEPAFETPQPAEQPEQPQQPAAEQAPQAPAPQPPRAPQQPAAQPAAAGPPGRAAAATAPAGAPTGGPAGRGPRSHILSPLVRRLAEEHGIDLGQVQGTGTGGRITKRDITAFIESGGAQAAAQPAAEAAPQPAPAPAPAAARAAVAPAAVGGGERVEPISHIRKRIAENMVASLQTSARAWNMFDIDMERIVRLRAKVKDRFKEVEGFSLTYMPFLARAVCEALHAFPPVNAKLNLQEGTITYHGYVNLGVAVATDNGLIVPIVKGADGMNVVGLARAINDVATRTRNKKLKPDEVHGGTFTITNPGPFGSVISVPIMNPGETAILAFDAIEKRPVVVDDMIGIRHRVYLSMSWDHRMIDGAEAAQFLARVKQNLETWDFTPEVQTYLG